MKNSTRFLVLILVSLFSYSSYAQIIITANDFKFNTQDSVRLVISEPILVVPDSGENVVWDYSNLITVQTEMISIGPDVASSAEAASFPNANVLVGKPSTELFFKIDSTDYESHGLFVKGGSPYVSTYTDNDLMLQFPCTYGDMFTDSLVGTYSVNGVLHTQKSKKHSKVTGHGELKLPGKTYPQVLLNRAVVYGETKKGNLTFDDKLIEYNFYGPITNYPVLTLYTWERTNNGSGVHQQTEVLYYDAITFIDIDDFALNQRLRIEAFPIPVRDIVHIKGIQTESPFVLRNALGAEVKKGFLSAENALIEMGELPAGQYFLTVTIEGQAANLKILKQ